jgi:8-oxo-dGTP pyrophosphatase MutT (NUDIX family)
MRSFVRSIIFGYVSQLTRSGKPLEVSFTRQIERLFSPVDAWGEFRPGARRAAVAFVLYDDGGRWTVPFVRRRADLRDHPGQVALPGGVVRPGEGAWEGAAREVTEEIGVPAVKLRPLGAGEPFYTAVSNFSVVPFVAWLPEPEPILVHDTRELDGVLEIPLARLLREEEWLEAAGPWPMRYFPWEESRVWGLTERILGDLLPRFRAAFQAAPGA